MAEDKTPKRSHPFVKGDGSTREYLWVTRQACTACNPYGMDEGRVLGVISDSEETLVAECLNCAEESYYRSSDFRHTNPPPKDYRPPVPGTLPPGAPRRQGEE